MELLGGKELTVGGAFLSSFGARLLVFISVKVVMVHVLWDVF